MHAPSDANLTAQNDGVEEFIREAYKAGAQVDLKVVAKGKQLQVPIANGEIELVNILTSVEYTIHLSQNGGPPVTHKVKLTIGAPPRARSASRRTRFRPACPARRTSTSTSRRSASFARTALT